MTVRVLTRRIFSLPLLIWARDVLNTETPLHASANALMRGAHTREGEGERAQPPGHLLSSISHRLGVKPPRGTLFQAGLLLVSIVLTNKLLHHHESSACSASPTNRIQNRLHALAGIIVCPPQIIKRARSERGKKFWAAKKAQHLNRGAVLPAGILPPRFLSCHRKKPSRIRRRGMCSPFVGVSNMRICHLHQTLKSLHMAVRIGRRRELEPCELRSC